MAVHFDLSVIAIVGILLLIGIVHKNGIMLVDFAMQAEQSEGLTTEESIYQAEGLHRKAVPRLVPQRCTDLQWAYRY